MMCATCYKSPKAIQEVYGAHAIVEKPFNTIRFVLLLYLVYFIIHNADFIAGGFLLEMNKRRHKE